MHDPLQNTRVEFDGALIQSTEDFYQVIGVAVGGDGNYFGSNLDALHDCLYGGYGVEPPCEFVWHNHRVSQLALGFPETIRQLEIRLAGCHPTARDQIAQEIKCAKRGIGTTVFDWFVSVFEDAEGVTLVLH